MAFSRKQRSKKNDAKSLVRLFVESLEVRLVPASMFEEVAPDSFGFTVRTPGTYTPNPTITYHGGALLQNVQIENIFYPGYNATLRSQLDTFFTDITASNYLTELVANYSVPGQQIGAGSFLGEDIVSTQSTPAGGSSLSDTKIQTMLSSELAANKIPDPTTTLNKLYFVFTPPGVKVTLGTANSVSNFLGYHSSFTVSGKTLAYAVMPYQGLVSGINNAELGQEVRSLHNLASSPFTELQDLTGVAAHEFTEAITDTTDAWWDSSDPSTSSLFPNGYENGDLANGELATYHGYLMQEEPTVVKNGSSAQQVGPISIASDADFFINQVYNPTAGNFSGVVATFSDKDGVAENDFFASVNWSDGAISSTTDGTGNLSIASNGDGTYRILGKHSYSQPVGTRYGSNAFNFDGLQVFVTDNAGEAAWNKPPVTLIQAAAVASITSAAANGVYGLNATIPIVVNFNEPVLVTGLPKLALKSGGSATYSSGSGTGQLTFNYTVGAGQNSVKLDYSSIVALTLNGGTITDTNANTAAATLTLVAPGAAGSLGANTNFVIDSTPPTASITSSPANFSNSTTPTFTFTGTDPFTSAVSSGVARFEVALDGSSFVTAVSPANLSVGPGSHTFQVRAVDNAGNVGTPTNYSWTIDTTAPFVQSIDRANPTNSTTNSSSVSYTVTFSEPVTGVDPTDFTRITTGTLSSTFTQVTPVSSSVYTVTISGILGNGTLGLNLVNDNSIHDQATNTLSGNFVGGVYTIDTMAPIVSFSSMPASATNSSDATFSFTGTDPVSGGISSGIAQLDYALDAGSFTTASSPVNLNNLTEGSHTFLVRAIDNVGNLSATVSYSWVIDTMAPTVSFTNTPPPLTYNGAVSFSFIATDPLSHGVTSGIDRLDYWLDSGTTITVHADHGAPSFAGLSAGPHVFNVIAFDVAGNSVATSYSWTIVTTQPTVTTHDVGGVFTGNSYPATASIRSGDGVTVVPGDTSFIYYVGASVSGIGSSTAPTAAGTYTVVAHFTPTDNVNYSAADSAAVTFTIFLPATHLAFFQQPGTNANFVAGASITPLVVELLDANNNVVTQDTSAISITLGANPGLSILGGSTTQNAVGGIATFSNLFLNKVGYGYTLNANDDTLTGVTSNYLIVNSAPTSQIAFIYPPPSATQAGNAFILGLQAQDAYGNATPNFSGLIHFASTDSQAILPTDTALSGGMGYFIPTLKTAGIQNLSATSGSISNSASITVSPSSPSYSSIVITGTPQSTTVNSAFATSLSITVKDAFGNTVAGAPITFTAPAIGASGTFSNNSASITANTNSNGVLTEAFSANTKAGSYSVSAAVTGVAPAFSYALTNIAGAASSIAATSGAGQSANTGTPFGSPIIATVTDSFGNPVPGVPVTFAAPGSGASATFATNPLTTNAIGQVTQSLTANANAGAYTISASVAGVGVPANFSESNTSPMATHFLITPIGGTNPISGIAYGFTVTAEDFHNNPVINYTGTVQFTSFSITGISFAGTGLSGGSTYTFTSNDHGAHQFSVTFSKSGTQSITVADTSPSGDTTGITSSATYTVLNFLVAGITPTSSGFIANFNKAFNTSLLSLYGSGTTTNPSVTLVGNHTGKIPGSLILNPSSTTVQFKATTSFLLNLTATGPLSEPVLPDDTYTITMLSGTNGFESALDNAPLDGATNGGTANFTTSFTTTYQADATTILSIPDFARGPDDTLSIKVPNNSGSGIPVTIYNDPTVGSLTDVTFTLKYNPTLLNISGANHGDSTDPSSIFTLVSNDSINGIASFSFHDDNSQDSTIAGVILGDIVATVPTTTAAGGVYGSKELLTIDNSLTTINGGSFGIVQVQSQPGIHVDAYLGDVTGNGTVDGTDAVTAKNVANGSATGFAHFKLLDPSILGDVVGSGSVDASSVTTLTRFAANLSIPQIPKPPAGVVVNQVDPALSLPPTLSAYNSIVNVPVLLGHTDPIGQRYDSTVLIITPADITIPAAARRSWQIQSVVDTKTRQIGGTLFSSDPITTASILLT